MTDAELKAIEKTLADPGYCADCNPMDAECGLLIAEVRKLRGLISRVYSKATAAKAFCSCSDCGSLEERGLCSPVPGRRQSTRWTAVRSVGRVTPGPRPTSQTGGSRGTISHAARRHRAGKD